MRYLKIEELKPGAMYVVDARNFDIAEWTGKVFVGLRHKFNDIYAFEENHWDDGEPGGTVKPLFELTELIYAMNIM
jgi:hypothetical protein